MTAQQADDPTFFASKVRRGGDVRDVLIINGRSLMTIDPRIPTMPGRSTSGFHRPGRHRLGGCMIVEITNGSARAY